MAIVSGAAVVLPSEYYDPAAALRAVELYRCTGIYGVPTMMVDMLSHPDLAKTSRASLRYVGASADLPLRPNSRWKGSGSWRARRCLMDFSTGRLQLFH